MRKAVLIAAAMAALFGLAGIAYAATTSARYDAAITPANAGTVSSPTNAVFKVITSSVSNDDGSQPPQVLTIKLAFDKNIKDNSVLFRDTDTSAARRCTTARLNQTKNLNDSACAGLKIGQSNATAQLGANVLRFQTILYGNGANSIIVAVKQVGGSVFKAFTARIVNVSGLYKRELQITIPADLRNIGGIYPSLTGLQQVQIGGYARKPVRRRVGGRLRTVLVGFLESRGCTARSFKTRAGFVFTATPTTPGNPPINLPDSSPCTT